MALTVLFLCTLAVFCNGTPLRSGLESRIVNGDEAKPGEFPFQVSLQISAIDAHFCGGSLINENYVLTAAHCVQNKVASEIKVVAGTVSLLKPGTVRNVAKVLAHEEFKLGSNSDESSAYDIALLKLESPIEATEEISFVTLPSKSDIVNPYEIATVSGWGSMWEGARAAQSLRRVNLQIADQGYCHYMYKKLDLQIYPSQICAYDTRTPRGSCHGDSGSPLTIKGKVVGIVSFAEGCAGTDYPTVYTRVVSHLDWINKNAM